MWQRIEGVITFLVIVVFYVIPICAIRLTCWVATRPRQLYRRLRWPKCPRCGSTKVDLEDYDGNPRGLFSCGKCCMPFGPATWDSKWPAG